MKIDSHRSLSSARGTNIWQAVVLCTHASRLEGISGDNLAISLESIEWTVITWLVPRHCVWLVGAGQGMPFSCVGVYNTR
jgi:hypothetical protein